MDMARKRLSTEVGAGCVKAIGSSVDRLDDRRVTELHERLTSEGDLVGW